MERERAVPQHIMLQDNFKRKFNFFELYCALTELPRAGRRLAKNKKLGLVAETFIERLQLAVTEVNGCAACSYAHAAMALKMGMSTEEINSFLTADGEHVDPEEARAVLFAQHFAEMRGKPEDEILDTLISEYGEERAKVMMAGCRVMLAGNIYGLPFSAFQSRLKKKPYKNSSLLYELGMLIGGILILPLALLHGLLKMLLIKKH